MSSLSIDKALGIHPSALTVRAERLQLLASNLANADTPNYKARDIDFRTVLSEVADSGKTLPLACTNSQHLSLTASTKNLNPQPLYRVPAQPSLDGNTVDPQMEHAAFAENAVQYQTSLEFLSRNVSGTLEALKAE
jgi:flagellar basal-body rod protein FlgB